MSTVDASPSALTVFTSVALRGVLDELAPDIEATYGCQLAMTFGPGNPLLDALRAGEVHDVLGSRARELHLAVAEGHAADGSVTEIGYATLGLAVPAGASRPSLATADDVAAALVGAEHVTYTDPATGAASSVHLLEVLDRMGLADRVAGGAKLGWGNPVGEFLVDGTADVAVQQLCELVLVDGIDIVGPLPDEMQLRTTIAVAVHARAARPDVATDLVGRLISPQVQSRLPDHGIEPIIP
jgi:molybdate transport system substrate-binding protein